MGDSERKHLSIESGGNKTTFTKLLETEKVHRQKNLYHHCLQMGDSERKHLSIESGGNKTTFTKLLETEKVHRQKNLHHHCLQMGDSERNHLSIESGGTKTKPSNNNKRKTVEQETCPSTERKD